MPDVEIYLYSNCTSCKKADALLRERNINARRRDLFKDRLSSGEIRDLLNRTGLTVMDVLSTRSRPYSELGLANAKSSDDTLIGLIAEYPALLRRPIIVKNGTAIVGMNRSAIDSMFGQS